MQYRDIAADNFRQVIAVGSTGDSDRLDELLIKLYNDHQIDHLFLTILDETINACTKSKAMENNFYMFTYVSKLLNSLKLEASHAPTTKVASKIRNDENIKHGTSTTDISETERQHKLIAAGQYINELIKNSNGDVKQLKERLISDYRSEVIEKEAFHVALQDNIDACQAAGYVNKGKLLQFMKDSIASEEARSKAAIADNTLSDDSQFDELSTHHAPKFVGERDSRDARSTVLSPSSFIDASNVSILEKVKNSKKKSEKKAAKLKVLSLADKVADHLSSQGWASIDNFVPLDIVRRVRIEAGLFKEHYEQSEIWVGKQADVGAHLVYRYYSLFPVWNSTSGCFGPCIVV